MIRHTYVRIRVIYYPLQALAAVPTSHTTVNGSEASDEDHEKFVSVSACFSWNIHNVLFQGLTNSVASLVCKTHELIGGCLATKVTQGGSSVRVEQWVTYTSIQLTAQLLLCVGEWSGSIGY